MPTFTPLTRYTEEQSAALRSNMVSDLHRRGSYLPTPRSLGFGRDVTFHEYAASIGFTLAHCSSWINGDGTEDAANIRTIATDEYPSLMYAMEESPYDIDSSPERRVGLRCWPGSVNPLVANNHGGVICIDEYSGVPLGWRRLAEGETTCVLDLVASGSGYGAHFAAQGSWIARGCTTGAVAYLYRHPLITDELAAAVRLWGSPSGGPSRTVADLPSLPADLFRRLPFLQLASWHIEPLCSMPAPSPYSSGGKLTLPKSIHSIPLPLP